MKTGVYFYHVPRDIHRRAPNKICTNKRAPLTKKVGNRCSTGYNICTVCRNPDDSNGMTQKPIFRNIFSTFSSSVTSRKNVTAKLFFKENQKFADS